jgi:hypothetical protein
LRQIFARHPAIFGGSAARALQTEASITAKLNRGTFAATFFLVTMKAIGRENVNVSEV